MTVSSISFMLTQTCKGILTSNLEMHNEMISFLKNNKIEEDNHFHIMHTFLKDYIAKLEVDGLSSLDFNLIITIVQCNSKLLSKLYERYIGLLNRSLFQHKSVLTSLFSSNLKAHFSLTFSGPPGANYNNHKQLFAVLFARHLNLLHALIDINFNNISEDFFKVHSYLPEFNVKFQGTLFEWIVNNYKISTQYSIYLLQQHLPFHASLDVVAVVSLIRQVCAVPKFKKKRPRLIKDFDEISNVLNVIKLETFTLLKHVLMKFRSSMVLFAPQLSEFSYHVFTDSDYAIKEIALSCLTLLVKNVSCYCLKDFISKLIESLLPIFKVSNNLIKLQQSTHSYKKRPKIMAFADPEPNSFNENYSISALVFLKTISEKCFSITEEQYLNIQLNSCGYGLKIFSNATNSVSTEFLLKLLDLLSTFVIYPHPRAPPSLPLLINIFANARNFDSAAVNLAAEKCLALCAVASRTCRPVVNHPLSLNNSLFNTISNPSIEKNDMSIQTCENLVLSQDSAAQTDLVLFSDEVIPMEVTNVSAAKFNQDVHLNIAVSSDVIEVNPSSKVTPNGKVESVSYNALSNNSSSKQPLHDVVPVDYDSDSSISKLLADFVPEFCE